MIEPVTFPIAVDVVALTVIDHTLNALVVRRGIEPFRGRLALPGGFLRSGEQTDQAAARDCNDEVGHPPGIDDLLGKFARSIAKLLPAQVFAVLAGIGSCAVVERGGSSHAMSPLNGIKKIG